MRTCLGVLDNDRSKKKLWLLLDITQILVICLLVFVIICANDEWALILDEWQAKLYQHNGIFSYAKLVIALILSERLICKLFRRLGGLG
jgi:hypothetical protein